MALLSLYYYIFVSVVSGSSLGKEKHLEETGILYNLKSVKT